MGQADNIKIATTTGGAGNEFYPSLPELEGTQNFVGRPHFIDGITGEGHSDGVTDTLSQQQANANG